ncbi:MAG: DinB family protein [Candidatus Rokubacteria bacterium]|nr:DinB family protein [Candidatus Rokubacteria bacterium]
MDCQAHPEGYAEIKKLGVSLVPALIVGDRIAHGWNPPAYAALVGVTLDTATKLPPRALGQRLDRILESSERLLRMTPTAHFGWKPPERDRTIGNLGFHVFRLSLAFIDGADRGEFPESWLQAQIPADLDDGPAVARYGALVRARLAGWFEGAGDQDFTRIVKVYYGPQPAHDLLERTTWHAAQHLRQLFHLADRQGIATPGPCPTELFEGLPLPNEMW